MEGQLDHLSMVSGLGLKVGQVHLLTPDSRGQGLDVGAGLVILTDRPDHDAGDALPARG